MCRLPPTVTWCSCIASSSAACVLGGVRLISSARITLAKIGPCRNRNSRVPGRLVLLDHLGAGDVGRHQVGRELDAAELQRQRVGQRADHQRLGQARHADQQAVPAGEHRDQQFLDHLLLADDHLAQLGGDAAVSVVELVHRLDVVVLEHESVPMSVRMVLEGSVSLTACQVSTIAGTRSDLSAANWQIVTARGRRPTRSLCRGGVATGVGRRRLALLPKCEQFVGRGDQQQSVGRHQIAARRRRARDSGIGSRSVAAAA